MKLRKISLGLERQAASVHTETPKRPDAVVGVGRNVASAPVQDPPLEQEWARITEAGVQKATELWQAARKMAVSGDWSGKDPVKKVWFSDVLASPKVCVSKVHVVRSICKSVKKMRPYSSTAKE